MKEKKCILKKEKKMTKERNIRFLARISGYWADSQVKQKVPVPTWSLKLRSDEPDQYQDG